MKTARAIASDELVICAAAGERLAGHVETTAREAERALQNAAKPAENAAASRDAVRQAMERRQTEAQARQADAQAKVDASAVQRRLAAGEKPTPKPVPTVQQHGARGISF